MNLFQKLYELLEKVRETAIQVGGTAADVAYAAGQKATELLGVAKANVKIAGLKASDVAAVTAITTGPAGTRQGKAFVEICHQVSVLGLLSFR